MGGGGSGALAFATCDTRLQCRIKRRVSGTKRKPVTEERMPGAIFQKRYRDGDRLVVRGVKGHRVGDQTRAAVLDCAGGILLVKDGRFA